MTILYYFFISSFHTRTIWDFVTNPVGQRLSAAKDSPDIKRDDQPSALELYIQRLSKEVCKSSSDKMDRCSNSGEGSPRRQGKKREDQRRERQKEEDQGTRVANHCVFSNVLWQWRVEKHIIYKHIIFFIYTLYIYLSYQVPIIGKKPIYLI